MSKGKERVWRLECRENKTKKQTNRQRQKARNRNTQQRKKRTGEGGRANIKGERGRERANTEERRKDGTE